MPGRENTKFKCPGVMVYWSARAAITEYHRLSDKQKLIFSQFWRLEMLKDQVSAELI